MSVITTRQRDDDLRVVVLLLAVAVLLISLGTVGYFLATAPEHEPGSPPPARAPGLLRSHRDAIALLLLCTLGPPSLLFLPAALTGLAFKVPYLVFMPAGLITGLVLVLVLGMTTGPTGARVLIGYVLMVPLSLLGMLLGPLVFWPPVVGSTVYGVPPPLVGMLIALMISSLIRRRS